MTCILGRHAPALYYELRVCGQKYIIIIIIIRSSAIAKKPFRFDKAAWRRF